MSPQLLPILTAVSTAALITAVATTWILKLAHRRQLFDTTDTRKIHTGSVPRLGGTVFMPAILCASAIVALFFRFRGFSPALFIGLCAILPLYAIGLIDDIKGIGYKPKFAAQLLSASILVSSGFASFSSIPTVISIPLIIIAVIFITNAINLIDGISGLASGLAAITFIIYGLAFTAVGQPLYAVISFAALGSMVAFFTFNTAPSHSRRKIFMGDTGSLTIGLLISALALKLLDTQSSSPTSIITILSPIAIPCFDVVRVFLFRISQHTNPFHPDRNHIHHLLMRAGLSERSALIYLLGSTIAICIANSAILAAHIDIYIILLADISVLILANYAVCRKVTQIESRTRDNSEHGL